MTDRVEEMIERLRNRSFRLATRDLNGDGAKLAKEAADMLAELRDALIGMDKWAENIMRAHAISARQEAVIRARNTLTGTQARSSRTADMRDGPEDMGASLRDRATRASHGAASRLHHSAGIPSAADDPVVGHKTFSDGHHEPLLKSEADALIAAVEAAEAKRRADMPDEASAIRQLFDAAQRLQELGWKDPIYAPKDGSPLDIIEIGSTGIHRGYYEGEWPTGRWWIEDDGDICPSRPALARPAQAGVTRTGGDSEAGSVAKP